MANDEKYIMLHCGKDQATEVLKDALNQGVERGLVVRSEVGKLLNSEFEKVKLKGYFPIGIIIDNEE